MTGDMPRISKVSVTGPGRLQILWRGSASAQEADLSQWIATGGEILAPLLEPAVFARAGVSNYGSAISWDDGAGDLSIDAVHLQRIIDK